ncbi:2,3-bisphosphoglycerate-independent phosphoglycerate mutase [Oscillibacter sp. MSJ-2]|uniref:2,3-bisphosphoglycerate-independent phosphoglycerate mutase n=1 Tax=Dysosmobacter acutus TaxID=2841504 RepID=A0ABS6F9X8_9FIRM|nr:2,3-bisphosphoglycerate-independent phosphoglycerate mutase [Dysosmobacter acutus]MBU5627089.1 2,3-bisphosphoglycerate-independent phosphoglycerate mutase [Dysosmobacter acutus]
MKYILVIGDGMADDPVAELGGKTPLETAKKPTIDRLAAQGQVGHVINCPEPLPAGSETAILSIFGCDPLRYFTGRSPMEAAASGIELRPGDVAYRCNLIALSDGEGALEQRRILSHSAGSIEGADALRVMDILEGDAAFRKLEEKAGMVIHRFPAFRQIAVQHGADVKGLRLIPPHDHLGEAAGPLLPSGNQNAKMLLEIEELAHRILDSHPFNEERRREGRLPANGIWFWAEGTAVELPGFQEAYGHWGGVISAVPLCHGIGVLRGLRQIEVEGATGELDTNFEGKMQAAYDFLHTEADFVCIHVEAPDECTHNGDLKGKLQAIEWLDSRLLTPLLNRLDGESMDYRMLLLSDHKTLTATRGHAGGPVPFLLYQSGVDSGRGGVYDENAGLAGRCVSAGCELLEYLFGRRQL